MLKAAKGYNILFREDFRSVKSVSENGGVITGTPVIDGSADLTTTDYIVYNRPVVGEQTSFSVRWKGTFDMTEDERACAFCLTDNIANGFENTAFVARKYAGVDTLLFGVGDGTNSYFVASTDVILNSNQVYDFVMVWNGGNSITVYIDGVAQTMTGANSGTVSSINLQRFTKLLFNKDIDSGGTRTTNTKNHSFEFFDQALTAEAVKDLYEQDTIPELNQPLISLPMRSSYYKENGVNLLVDGDCEAADVSAWSTTNVTLTKVSGARTGGSGSLILRHERTGITGAASQSILTAGKRYKVTGWARSVGTTGGVPTVMAPVGSTTVQWAGTASTDWQYFEVEFVMSVSSSFSLYSGVALGNATEWDDLTVELMEHLTENKGTLGGTAKLGDGSTTTTMPTQLSPRGMSFDGGDYLQKEVALTGTYSVAFLLRKKTNATYGSTSYLFDGRADGGFGFLYHDTSAGTLLTSAGTVYVNGIQTTSMAMNKLNTVIVSGTTLTSVTKFIIASYQQIAGNNNFFYGDIIDVKLFTGTLTATQIRLLHNKLIKELNV